MQRQYRKFVLQLYRRLRHPRKLKQSRVLRWFATHFLDKSVWRPSRHGLAGGAAVGVFISSLLLPGQMPAAAFLCGMLRLNIPIAIVMCWISNPLTFAPVAWWEINLGNWIMDALNMGHPIPLSWHELTNMARQAENLWGFFDDVRPWGYSLYLGGTVAGLVLAPITYAIVFLLWDMAWGLSHKNKTDIPDAEKLDTGKKEAVATSSKKD